MIACKTAVMVCLARDERNVFIEIPIRRGDAVFVDIILPNLNSMLWL